MPQLTYTQRKVPSVMFVNCGHGDTRRIEDNKRLSFISAGQGRRDNRGEYYFSNQIRNLIPGDILAVYRNDVGYVGIARAIGMPMPITNAFLAGKKVTKDIFHVDANMFNDSFIPGYEEWLIEIKWLTDVYLLDERRNYPFYGGFDNRNTVCSLENQEKFKSDLEKGFNLNFENLLIDSKQILTFQFQEENEELAFPEGSEKFHLHRMRERSSKLIETAKRRYYCRNNEMPCEICGFSFVKQFGKRGIGYIEVHHTIPVSSLTANSVTKIEDLAFLCSNCHRMVHRERPWLTLHEIKSILSGN